MPADSNTASEQLAVAASPLAIDEQYMRNALDLAQEAVKRNEVPIGAIVVRDELMRETPSLGGLFVAPGVEPSQ